MDGIENGELAIWRENGGKLINFKTWLKANKKVSKWNPNAGVDSTNLSTQNKIEPIEFEPAKIKSLASISPNGP